MILCQIIFLVFGCAAPVKKVQEQNIPVKSEPAASVKEAAPVSGPFASVPKDAAAMSEAPAAASKMEAAPIEAVAVYYARRYEGRKTSSGQRYNAKLLTAAHPTIPLGTKVKVVNRANEKSVIVTVNDRCRLHDYELIDLSRAAARKLGFLHRGSARVWIIPVGN